MISERAPMAATFKAEGEFEAAKIRNETDKTVEILLGEARAQAQRLVGEGEEEYMAILKELYNDPAKADFYVFVRELEAAKKALAGDKTLIIGQDSPSSTSSTTNNIANTAKTINQRSTHPAWTANTRPNSHSKPFSPKSPPTRAKSAVLISK